MSENTVIAIDLAKHSFHVCVLSTDNKVLTDKTFTRSSLKTWLLKQKPSLVAIEACGSAHYWAKLSEQYGHTTMLISPRFVKRFLSGHKTDKNDALAIAIASRQPDVKPIQVKTDEQLALQASERIREHYVDEQIATNNLLKSILYEFGITVAKGKRSLVKAIPDILEDAENGLPDVLRGEIHRLYQFWLELDELIQTSSKRQQQSINAHPKCSMLKALDGVGDVNALGLYLALGDTGASFKNGREAAACIGLTPKQHSTGGKTVMLGISKYIANKKLRSNL
ncbi:IS110 family transposase, partial [Aestuariibacter salexigens]|uniref:IS110 family transposase n=1 Tax=Aestuariibacter salexigens TaxID=226010 RepID=UPI00047D24AE